MASPFRGEVWLAELDPVRGHEQAGRRPVLIVSENTYNQGPAGLVVALAITSKSRGIPIHVSLHPPEGGLKIPSVILCDQIRSISKERLAHLLGKVSAHTLSAVDDRLKILLNLE